MNTIYLGLGSNLGDREKNLLSAIDKIRESGISILKVSSFLETDPVGGPVQEKYINAVMKGETELSPLSLLEKLQEIENELGRIRTVPSGPRTIDIDILLYGDLEMNEENLTIPHPRMLARDFVMSPLKEIEPELFKSIQA